MQGQLLEVLVIHIPWNTWGPWLQGQVVQDPEEDLRRNPS